MGLRGARRAAAQVATKNVELRTARGLDVVRLAVGLATWADGDRAYCAPILLRPTAIRRHHTDFEVKLHGSFTANPELVRALATQFGVQAGRRPSGGAGHGRRRVQPAAGDRPACVSSPRTSRPSASARG
ncbi:hypothetical protein [Microbacterium elymi]|uniref:Uncharacterized protein n=1 Tax=Microbacterium elymi TaxID=2909587 RepID=A0ABY5NKG3_9MICO|nr:hypothetical protein [Microbacterium elymi]UUT35650.1 hypothetical protein L2X98_20480 [Microbacterium elymi]